MIPTKYVLRTSHTYVLESIHITEEEMRAEAIIRILALQSGPARHFKRNCSTNYDWLRNRIIS